MAKAYYLTEIDMLGAEFFADEREHEELVRCNSGNFIYPLLVFTGCKTIGDYWDWQKDLSHNLCIRYWDKKPTDEERKNTPWTPYEVAENGSIHYITEEDFRLLKKRAALHQETVSENYKDTFSEIWKGNGVEVFRSRT